MQEKAPTTETNAGVFDTVIIDAYIMAEDGSEEIDICSKRNLYSQKHMKHHLLICNSNKLQMMRVNILFKT